MKAFAEYEVTMSMLRLCAAEDQNPYQCSIWLIASAALPLVAPCPPSVGLARMEFVVQFRLRVHPMALGQFRHAEERSRPRPSRPS